MARKAGELKKRCWLAKQRLKMGYWESLKNDNAVKDADVISRAAANAQAAWVRSQSQSVAVVSPQDEKMYRKVCAILENDEVTLNPIGQLIEQDVYNEMDAASRQRYVLELSEKFRELKDRYYREKTGA